MLLTESPLRIGHLLHWKLSSEVVIIAHFPLSLSIQLNIGSYPPPCILHPPAVESESRPWEAISRVSRTPSGCCARHVTTQLSSLLELRRF